MNIEFCKYQNSCCFHQQNIKIREIILYIFYWFLSILQNFYIHILFCSLNTVEESNKKNYVNVWEAASTTFKMIGGLNWKKNKKRNATSAQEQFIPMADDGVDEVDSYTNFRPGVNTVSMRSEQQIGQHPDAMLDALRDGLADMVFSDEQPIVTYNSQNHSQSENSVSSLDG